MLPWWFFAIGAAVFGAVREIFRKKGTQREHSMEFAVTRSTLAAIFGLLLIPFMTFKYDIRAVMIIYFVSILGSIGIYLTTKSLKHADISEVTPLHNLTPGFLAVLAFLLLGESLSLMQAAGIVLLVIGSYVLETDHRGFWISFVRHMKSRYVDYAIIASLIFAITALMEKYVINVYTLPFDFLFLLWIFISLNFIFISSIMHDGIFGIRHCLRLKFKEVTLTAFFSFLSNAFYVYALSLAYVSLVIPIRRLSTLITVIVGGELFHEDALLRKSIACAIMILGACFIIL